MILEICGLTFSGTGFNSKISGLSRYGFQFFVSLLMFVPIQVFEKITYFCQKS
jgi:hypothetical protein